MKVRIIDTAKKAENRDFQGKNVVVIDVFRATSVMITALKNGAKKIYPSKDIAEALEKNKVTVDSLLAGERYGAKIEGFDLGNSPFEFSEEVVKGKTICMTTSNGTRAIKNSMSGDNIYIASFLNLSAIVKKLLEDKKDVVIICSGTEDKFSLEDCLCAGFIVDRLSKQIYLHVDDFTISLQQLADKTTDIDEVLKNSQHYKFLKKIGCEKDLKFCMELDSCNLVPTCIDGEIVLN